MYDVIIRHEDGRRTDVKSGIDDLGAACAFVLKLADTLGKAPDDDNPAKCVEIYRDERLEISVSVMQGGLAGREKGPG